MDDEQELAVQGIDLTHPNPARVYDWFLGGTANWAVDRELGEKAVQMFPLAKQLAQANRDFLRQVVRYCVGHGVRQFLDLGSGVPTVGNVHEIAGELDPDSRCVYVDNEPVAVAHSEILLEQNGDPSRHAVINADLRDSVHVWNTARETGVLDPDQPICLLMIAVAHFIDSDTEVQATIEHYRSRLPVGSYFAASHFSEDGIPDTLAEHTADGLRLYRQSSAPLHSRDRDEFGRFFQGMDLVEPGITSVTDWQTDGERYSALGDAGNMLLAGVARV